MGILENESLRTDFLTYGKADFLNRHNDVTPAEYAEANKVYKGWKAKDDIEQGFLFNDWFELIKAHWDESMWSYFKKDEARIVKLDCGRYIEIEKPRIHTEFCFGYGTFESYPTSADYMAQSVKEDGGEYFLRRNLRDIDESIKELETGSRYDYNRGEKGYSFGERWYNSPDALGYYRYLNPAEFEDYAEDRKATAMPLTENDIANLLKGYKIVRLEFMKRLNTYLKKYGTSKLRTWTYWEDE